jgi:hypothetical protein
MRITMHISQPRSSFSVDLSSIYHPPPCLLSFHKILKLTSKIHPTQNVAQKITSIHQLSISSIVHFYCVTGVADGDVRVWVSFPSLLFFIGLWLRGGSTKFCFWPPYAFSWPVGRAWVACVSTRLALEVWYSELGLRACVKRVLNTFEIICLSLLFF